MGLAIVLEIMYYLLKETTVGAIQRRLIQWILHRHFFNFFRHDQNSSEMDDAA